MLVTLTHVIRPTTAVVRALCSLLNILNILQLGRRLFTHLKVYKGAEHPHEAQKPVPLPIKDKRIQKSEK